MLWSFIRIRGVSYATDHSNRGSKEYQYDLLNGTRIERAHRYSKNGYDDMVIMSMEAYEQSISSNDLASQLGDAERDFEEGKTIDAFESLDAIEAEYGL